MKRRIVKGLLIAGVILGFGSGIVHARHGHHGWRGHSCGHRQDTVQDFARECVRAAREAEKR